MHFALKFLPIFFITIITIGCGNANLEYHDSMTTTGSKAVGGNIIPVLSIKQKEKTTVLHYSITNHTEHTVTYTFPTSERFDYIVTSDRGTTVKRYSEEKVFTQNIAIIKLQKGKSLTYHATIYDIPKGNYLVTMWLTAKEDQFKSTAMFTIK